MFVFLLMQESGDPVPEPKDVPVLVQLRLLDQRDSTAKVFITEKNS